MRLTALFILFSLAVPTVAQPLINPTGSEAREIAITPASDLDTILDALNARGQNLADFTADVVLHTIDMRTGQDTSQIGTVVFQNRKGVDSRIKVAFETKRTDEGIGHPIMQKQKLDYLLDKGWLTDRDYQKKLEVKRQVLRPDQKMNLLKLGEGPFPLPIGQDKEDVKKQFTVSKVETSPYCAAPLDCTAACARRFAVLMALTQTLSCCPNASGADSWAALTSA